MMKRIKEKIKVPFDIIKIIIKFEPKYLLFALPQIIFNAVLPVLYIYFPKLIIELLTSSASYVDILYAIAIYVVIILFINLINTYLSNKSMLLGEDFTKTIKREIGHLVMKSQFYDVESPDYQDIIQMANNATNLIQTINIFQNIISSIITIASLLFIIAKLDLIFIGLVTITLIVKIIFVYKNIGYIKKLRAREAKNNRVYYYLYQTYLSEGGAKEIRLNNLQNWFTKYIWDCRQDMLDFQFHSMKRYSSYNIITSLVLALQSLIVLIMLANKYINNSISIADVTMYFTAITTLTTSLSTLTEKIGEFNQQALNVVDYKKIECLAKNTDKSNGLDFLEEFNSEQIEIEFKNVSFSYPNNEKKVLDNISIKILNKEKLVIVGPNGAGKTTFVKLLCKFYKPTEGKITINGIDIWNISNKKYYEMISAVFQDFNNFSFSLKENIAMTEDVDSDKLFKTIKDTGLTDCVTMLPNGIDTFISKNFDSNGIELSGGQNQKVAIARSIYKDAKLLILDEPTASLDPKAESEIYHNFFNISKNKTAIFISHRLAASTVADNIAVFKDGKIIEYGPHEVLLEKKGLYSEMYLKQKKAYADEKIIF